MNPDHDICVILLNNITSTSLERIGNSIYKIITDKPYSLPKPKQEIQLKKEVLLSYAGKYEISENYIAEVTFENGTLFLQINTDTKLKLSAEKENVFFIKEEDITVEFTLKENKISEIKIRQGVSTKTGDKLLVLQ